MKLVAALYVDAAGTYSKVPNVDVWPLERDARRYCGPYPVVAHPPCSRWCQLAYLNQARYGHRVGDDGGCFKKALAAVRRFGGILEHPAKTLAWNRYRLKIPKIGSWQQADEGWVTEVSQAAYGHRAKKMTWLYAVSIRALPPLDWSTPRPTASISYLTNHGGGSLPRLSKKEASATPDAFRDLLLTIARMSVLR